MSIIQKITYTKIDFRKTVIGGIIVKKSLIKYLIVAVVLGLCTFNNSTEVKAKSHEQKQLEEFIKGNNYISAEEATKQYVQKIGKSINLPERLPFEPTHRFGIVDEEGRLKLHYMKYDGQKHTLDFIFYVMSESEIDTHVTSNDQMYKLSNGSEAYYRENPNDVLTLTLKKDGIGYSLGGSKTDNFNLEVLLDIAESI
ncbi:autoinducer [Halalkalibacter alkalisediminis]|uniref:Autoinducer n=1 Tax=Halalkalibacter alkalisediminis TaxID=935616 RepID=A0ABV6NL05_9BACI|nr:autoinducer [Halalkalibacter alkalisediminis]